MFEFQMKFALFFLVAVIYIYQVTASVSLHEEEQCVCPPGKNRIVAVPGPAVGYRCVSIPPSPSDSKEICYPKPPAGAFN